MRRSLTEVSRGKNWHAAREKGESHSAMHERTKEQRMTHFKGLSLLFLIACGAILLSACTTTTTPGAIKSPQTPAQVLQKSQDAMKHLTSVHLGLSSSSTVQLPTPPFVFCALVRHHHYDDRHWR